MSDERARAPTNSVIITPATRSRLAWQKISESGQPVSTAAQRPQPSSQDDFLSRRDHVPQRHPPATGFTATAATRGGAPSPAPRRSGVWQTQTGGAKRHTKEGTACRASTPRRMTSSGIPLAGFALQKPDNDASGPCRHPIAALSTPENKPQRLKTPPQWGIPRRRQRISAASVAAKAGMKFLDSLGSTRHLASSSLVALFGD